MWNRPVAALRRAILDRLVLRPTRHEIVPMNQSRVILGTGSQAFECFVHRWPAADAETSKDGSQSLLPRLEPPELVVLKFPGTAGRAERSSRFPADLLCEDLGLCRSADVWTWNPPGYGRSRGRATLASLAARSIDFWNLVTARYPDPATRIWLCGNSLGCAVALHVAATKPQQSRGAAMILRNPPPLIPVVKRVARQYPFGNWIDAVADSLEVSMNATVTAARVDLPAVFLQSELDSLVPPWIQQEIIDAFAGPKQSVMMLGLEHDGVPDETHQVDICRAIDALWHQSAGVNQTTS